MSSAALLIVSNDIYLDYITPADPQLMIPALTIPNDILQFIPTSGGIYNQILPGHDE